MRASRAATENTESPRPGWDDGLATLGDFTTTRRVIPITALGILTRSDVRKRLESAGDAALRDTLASLARPNPVAAYPDEPLRAVVYRMAEQGVTRLPVIERGESRKLLGLVSLDDLLKARVRNLTEGRQLQRVLRLQFLWPRARTGAAGARNQD
ncbi:MAG TPA: CBS domain-containing protein [Methylomirabilota bacterium]|nr:CBS domain-containing protein [Methylomirabilota bacterium]